MEKSNKLPEGYHDVMVYLNIRHADKAIEFYKKAFGATEVGRLTMPGNVVAHAELKIGHTIFMIAEAMEEWGNKAPESYGGSPVGLCLYSDDVDRTYQRAIALGATVDRGMEPKDQFYGDRTGTLTDPFGHRWTIAQRVEELTWPEMQERMEKAFSQQPQN